MDKETEEKIIDLQGQIDELNKNIQGLKPIPEVNKVRPYTDIKKYQTLRVEKLYASLPIYDTSTTTNHLENEIYLTKIGSTTTLHTFINGVEVDL
jgi:hypothetical protein